MTTSLKSLTELATPAFEFETRTLSLDKILPLRRIRRDIKYTRAYRQIRSSIKAIGLVEHLVVTPNPNEPGSYFLLDGLLRLEVLKENGVIEVECLVATDDEAYTYNRHVNRISLVQEHHMVTRAVSQGASMERIAKTLNLEQESVRRRMRLLDGIRPEVAQLLGDKLCPIVIFGILRQMQPERQLEATQLMVGQANYSIVFARAILAATPPEQLVPERTRKAALNDVSRAEIARLERELAMTQQRTRSVEESYGIDNLTLTVTKTYLAKLLRNPNVAKWLEVSRPDFLAEFQSIAQVKPSPLIDQHVTVV